MFPIKHLQCIDFCHTAMRYSDSLQVVQDEFENILIKVRNGLRSHRVNALITPHSHCDKLMSLTWEDSSAYSAPIHNIYDLNMVTFQSALCHVRVLKTEQWSTAKPTFKQQHVRTRPEECTADAHKPYSKLHWALCVINGSRSRMGAGYVGT